MTAIEPKDPELAAAFQVMGVCASILAQFDWEKLIASRERADNIGAMFQPTAWLAPGSFDANRAGIDAMNAAVGFVKAFEKVAKALVDNRP